jgi:hypothetical protein
MGEEKPSTVETYHARYSLAGYLLRAGTVCDPDDSRHSVDAAFSLLATGEIKTFSKAYPRTVDQWMTEGATNFNTEVMKDGIKPTCLSAMSDRQHILDINAARDRQPAPAHPPAQEKKSSKHNWVSVEADNGAVIKVDMNSIQRGTGAAIVFTYADEGNPEDAYKLQGYMFDCRGHYSVMGLSSSPMLYAPPRSVAARISDLACSVPVGTVPH